MGIETKNGWKKLIETIQYDIQVIKETMINLDRKVTEIMIKHNYLEKRVDNLENNIQKRQQQAFFVVIGGIISFLSGLILLLFSLFSKK